MKRIYLSMVGDLFHLGHLNIIKKAKLEGDYLICGVHSDKVVESYKQKPIINEQQRYEIIRSLKYVDEVIENAPLILTAEFYQHHKIDLEVHGDDCLDENGNLKGNLKKFYTLPLKLKKIKFFKYTKNISTTDIIKRILKKNK